MKELTKAEETLLLAILRLKGNAYGVAIKQHIQKTTGKALDMQQSMPVIGKDVRITGSNNSIIGDPVTVTGNFNVFGVAGDHNIEGNNNVGQITGASIVAACLRQG